MANRYYKKPASQKPAPTGNEGPAPSAAPVKTASWPGLPGPAKSSSWDAGDGPDYGCDPKRFHFKSEGVD